MEETNYARAQRSSEIGDPLPDTRAGANIIDLSARRPSPFQTGAFAYIDRGLPAIPAMYAGKVPGTFRDGHWRPMVGWQRYADVMPTDAEYTAWDTWPGANICIPLGGISGIMAVDIDMEGPILEAIERELSGLLVCRKRGAKGYTAFMQCAGTPWAGKNSLQSKWNITRRVNGQVVLDPQGRPKQDRVVDIIAYGKQTVLPPSLHPDGMLYSWITPMQLDNCTALFDLPTVPHDLCERITRAVAPFDTEHGLHENKLPRAPKGVMPAESWFQDLNAHALAHLDAWVPALLPSDVPSGYVVSTGDGYRIKPYWRGVTDAHKVSAKPTGIRDFAEDRGYTPIDLVMATRNLSATDAIAWLTGYVSVPDPLGGVEIFADAVPTKPALASPPEQPVVTPALVRVPVRDLARAVSESVQHVIAPYVPEGEVTVFGAHGGMGKTTFAQVLLAHAACGCDWAGCAVSGGRVVFITLEDPAARVIARFRQIAEAYGLDMRRIEENVILLDGTDGDACLAVEEAVRGRSALVFTRAMEEIEEAAHGVRLIVLDNASDAFDANENERRMVRAFIRRLRAIAKANNAGLILLAHVDKQAARIGGAGNTYSGSTAWHNSARSRLALVDVDGVIELRHEKNNLGKKAEPLPLRFTDDGVLVPAFRGEIFDGNDDVLLRCVADAIVRGDIISTARTGPGNAHAHVRTLPGFPTALAPPRKFWAAIARLEHDGKLLRETYTNPARKSRERWQLPVAQVAPVTVMSAFGQ